MRIQFYAGAAALVLAAGAAAAQGQDARAADVLAKTRQAIGGAKLDALRTLSVDATLQRNVGERQLSSDVTIHLEMPARYVRVETPNTGMGMQMNSGFNGDQVIRPAGTTMTMSGGAMMIRMGGPGGPPPPSDAPKPTPEQLAEMSAAQLKASRAEISRMMLGWFGMAHPSLQAQYTYAGEAESPDGKAHVIDVKNSDGFAARLFIDQNTNLPLMVTYEAPQPRIMTASRSPRDPAAAVEEMRRMSQEPPALVEFALFVDDWREIDGIRFPHVVRRASAGTTSEEWTISKVKVNPKIDAKVFAVENK